jgi:AAHS family 4-hydroxybenzoate transporter-like MFS transporter
MAREGRQAAELTNQNLRPLTRLISDGRGLTTTLFCGAVFLMLLTSYFLVSWTPALLVLNGVAPQRAAVAAVLLNFGGVVGALILSFIIRTKSPVLVAAIVLSVGAILVVIFGQAGVLTGTGAMVSVFAIGAFIIGVQGCIPALAVHLYPESVHATGVGLSMATGRIGSIVGPLIGGYLVSIQIGWGSLLLLAAGPSSIAAIAMATLFARGIK